MMSKPLASLLLVVSMLAYAFSASASESSLIQARMVMQTVLNTESGYINKAVHGEFWRLLDAEAGKDPRALSQILLALDQVRVMASGYPLETWQSIRQSHKQRKVVRTPGFVKMSAELRAIDPQIAESVDKAERFLVAAANRTPISVRGQTIYIDEERINSVLDGIEASQSRLERLFNKQWSEEMTEQPIPAARVTILTPDLFTISRQQVPGAAASAITAKRNFGPNSIEQIMLFQVPATDKTDLARRALLACEGAFRAIGLTCRAAAMHWRGLPGITAADSTSVDGIKVGFAMQVIMFEGDQSLQTFSVIVPGTATDATLGLDSLMHRVKDE
jgi:hypothetical protein